MNILFCNKFFYEKGGAEVSMFNTAKVLEQKGHKAIHFSMKHPANLPSEFSKYFVSNVDYDQGSLYNRVKAAGRIFYSIEARTQVRQILKDYEIDIVHPNNIAHQISPSILYEFKNRNIPVVMSLRDYKLVCPSYNMLASGKPCEKCKGRRFYSAFLKRCHKGSLLSSTLLSLEMTFHHHILHIYDLVDVFIATSRFQKEKIYHMGFRGKVLVLPNFVDLRDYPTPSYEFKRPVVVYFGRVSPEKGLNTLCEAIKGLDVTLYLIGGGPEKKALVEKVAREEIKNIKFWSHLPRGKLIAIVSKAMFVVFPSEWYETFGRTALEAFAMGKPVIGAGIGGIPEIVINGETGFLFEPGDKDDLRQKIQSLIGDKEAIIRMGKKARKFVEEEFNAEVHYKRLMGIYSSVMK